MKPTGAAGWGRSGWCSRLVAVWLLQPLDTHGFAAYKAFLQKAYQRARIRSLNGVLDLAGFLRCVEQAIRNIFQGRSWGRAFDADGFGHQQADVSRRVRAALEVPLAEETAQVAPTGVRGGGCQAVLGPGTAANAAAAA